MLYEVAMAPLFFGALGGLTGRIGWVMMLVLYGLVMIAVWLNRLEKASQGSELVLPTGQRLQVDPTLQLESLSDDQPKAANMRLFAENVWDWGLSELRWWQLLGALFVLLSLAYGVGLMIFAMLYPGSRTLTQAAPYAFLNAVLMAMVLVIGSPSKPSSRKQGMDDDAERFAAAFSTMRRIEPTRQASWQATTMPSPGNAVAFQAGERLAYELVASPSEAKATAYVEPGVLFLTLFLSALIAPLFAAMSVGGLVLLTVVKSAFFLPIFAWTSGGLTLFFALLSFFLLRRSTRATEPPSDTGQFVFDFAENNIYARQGEDVTPYHFSQCHALLLSVIDGEVTELTPPQVDLDAQDDSNDDSDDEQSEEPGETEEEPLSLAPLGPSTRLHLYGAGLPTEGLLIASFHATSLEDGEPRDASQRFGAMLSIEMGLPLFATHEFPS